MTRVTVVSPEPTPYRAPLFDRIAARPDIDLTVIYAGRTVARRTWTVEIRHRGVFLRGPTVPGAQRVLRHDYPLAPGFRELARSNPEVVVVMGWSTLASQAAIVWCRARGVPYVLAVENHDFRPRPPWRRVVKGAVAPLLLRNAASVLVAGTLARESVIRLGAKPELVRVFANSVDVDEWERRANELHARREKFRRQLGARDGAVIVISVGRLITEKGMDVLVRAAAGEPRLFVLIAGSGPEERKLVTLADETRVRLRLLGDLPLELVREAYCAADVFALLARYESWGVVVNEAAATGLPLVLSNRVGAAGDLLRDGENGLLVPAEDVDAAAKALRELTADPEQRRRFGERSRELVRGWGYEPSVENFVAAVREARAT